MTRSISDRGSTEVVRVSARDFGRIHSSLLIELDPKIPRGRWQRLFEWGWENPEDHSGFALVDGAGQFVGFMATIYSDQMVSGRTERFCNVSSWIVKEGFRSSALSLLLPVISRPELTVTNLTSIPTVNRMFRSLGFQTLETHIRVCFPISRGRPGRRGRQNVSIHLRSEFGKGELPERVGRRVGDLADVCSHWFLRTADEVCHVAFSLGRRRHLPTIRIHEVSEPDVFVRGLPELGRRFLREFKAPQFELDERLLRGREVKWSQKIPLPETRLFRSQAVNPKDISNLYSELPLLSL